MAFCLIACTAFAMYLVVCGLSRIKEAARSQGVLDVDGYKEWLNVKNTHIVRMIRKMQKAFERAVKISCRPDNFSSARLVYVMHNSLRTGATLMDPETHL